MTFEPMVVDLPDRQAGVFRARPLRFLDLDLKSKGLPSGFYYPIFADRVFLAGSVPCCFSTVLRGYIPFVLYLSTPNPD